MTDKNQLIRRRIIKDLYYSNSVSSAELCLKTGKSLPITMKFVNDLIKDGIVIEKGYGPSTGGRRAVRYSLAPGVLFTVSVAMDQFITRIAIMDMHNEFVIPVEKFELALPGNEEALSVLVEKIEDFINRSGIPKNKLAGVGIGMPGFVDVKKGINYSFLPTEGKSINDYVHEKLKIPVYIENDSSLTALAELYFGAANGKRNTMVINAGWGVGLGMILDGKLFRGDNGFAGEFSHISLYNNNKLCFCGKTGCLETESSLLVVIEKAIDGLKAGRLSKLKLAQLPADHAERACDAIIAAAHAGDQFAIELLSDAGSKIGRGIAILIHLLNPELIVLSGRGASAGKMWLVPIQKAVNEHSIPRLASNTSIEISTLGYNAELIGAAALVMENYGKHQEIKNALEKKTVAVDETTR